MLSGLSFIRLTDMEAYTGESDRNSLRAPLQMMGANAPSELALHSGSSPRRSETSPGAQREAMKPSRPKWR
jgi:hypothetical protein